jgi:hypothetical protein
MANAHDSSRRLDPALVERVATALVEDGDLRAACAALSLDDGGRAMVARLVDSALTDFRTPEAGMAALAWMVAAFAGQAQDGAATARKGGKTLVYLWPRVPRGEPGADPDPGQLSLDLDVDRKWA